MVSSTRLYEGSNWLEKVIRFVVFNLVGLFYPNIKVRGRKNLPKQGPVIFVLNHPNGLLDAILLMVGLDWPVSFWAKSTLFGNPVGKLFCESFDALPIFRKRDEGLPGGPRGDAKERNEETFAQCRRLLLAGGAMALFPEGVTHSNPQLLEMRTGAARIALSTEAQADWQGNVQVVPVGLWYENKTLFRTSVLLVVGQPFDLKQYAQAYATHEHQTVRTVTDEIEAGLDAVVLQAENAELLSAIPVLAAWTVPEGEAPELAQHHEWTSKLFAAYEHLHHHNPERLDRIAQQARSYASRLQSFGINNPWTLEVPSANPWRVTRLLLILLVTFPLALVGFLLSYLPYRLAGPVAIFVIGKYETQISTFKLIGGAIFVLVGWIVESVLCGLWFGWGWGVLLFIVVPPLSYVALRWGEYRRELGHVISTNWFRLQRRELAQSLMAQRQALAHQVLDAVQATLGSTR